MRRARKRNRSTWFPIIGATQPAPGITNVQTIYTTFTGAPADYDTDFDVTPIIPDFTVDPNVETDTFTLRDYVEGQTCVIERIVGKIVCMARQDPVATDFRPPTVMIACAAIAVLPVLETAPDVPAVDFQEYNPLLAANADKPYYWRRTWVLSNNTIIPGNGDFVFNAPACNEFFASRDDGPHIDTKGVRRVIQRNQRMFLILCAGNIEPGDVATSDGSIFWCTDLRVLGSMRRAKNKSLFT